MMKIGDWVKVIHKESAYKYLTGEIIGTHNDYGKTTKEWLIVKPKNKEPFKVERQHVEEAWPPLE